MSLARDPELFKAWAAHQEALVPLQRVGNASEGAAYIYWLASGASLMTGNILTLDCGLHLNGDG